MAMGILFVGGNCVPFHPLLSHPKLLVMGRAQLVLGLPEGRSRTSVPRGHRARGEVPRDLKAPCLEQDAPHSGPGPHPLSWVCLSWFPAPQPQRPRSGPASQSLLITALAWPAGSYLCLGPQSTWPPGLCPAGSQAAGAPASVAGSCSPPAPPPPAQLGLGFQGLVWGGWRGRCLSISPTADLCTFLVPRDMGDQGVKSGDQHRPSLTSPVILGGLFPPL